MDQLLYSSHASPGTPSDEIFRIIATSARNNGARGVTGFLIYAQDRFLQLIEGEAAALDALLADLRNDSRHRDLQILSRKPVDARSFPGWRMERIAVSPGEIEMLLRKLREHNVPADTRDHVRAFFASPGTPKAA